MALLEWSDKYSVNIKEIDTQHKKMFEVIYKLHDAMSKGQTKGIMEEVLKDLIEYSGYHFNTEEIFMKQFNFPGYDSHLKEHDSFKQDVAALYADYIGGKIGVSIKLTMFLREWLNDHILNVDKLYGPFLNAKGIF